MVRPLGLSRGAGQLQEPQGLQAPQALPASQEREGHIPASQEREGPQGRQLPESLFILKIHGSLDVMMKKTAMATLVGFQAIRRREER
tara:strand:- start:218 stop:481 length:264 start_codon:yes stop_codon:yes gene_type:complete